GLIIGRADRRPLCVNVPYQFLFGHIHPDKQGVAGVGRLKRDVCHIPTLQHAKFIPVTVRACRQTLTVHAPMLRDELLTLWEDGLYTAALCPTSDIIEAYKGVRHRKRPGTPPWHGVRRFTGVRHLPCSATLQ